LLNGAVNVGGAGHGAHSSAARGAATG